jgi:acyl-coenzyme A thioesterase PaaI-like protein
MAMAGQQQAEANVRSNINLLSKLDFLSARRRFELYPPYFLMRVKVIELAQDWSMVRIRLPLNWISANAAGNMFGGYQASLADPVPALACLKKFTGYRVATRKLELDFIRVGNSSLMLHFDFGAQTEHDIRQALDKHGHATPCFTMTYVREDGQICTRIKNTVAIRPKGYVSKHE